jgi:UDP-glucose 4-epimerase
MRRPRRAGAFVFLSSSGVFAPTDGAPDLADACTPTATHPYAAAKRAGEVLVPAALAGHCLGPCRPLGYLYGPGEAHAAHAPRRLARPPLVRRGPRGARC